MNIEITYTDGINLKLVDIDNNMMWSTLEGLIPNRIPHMLPRVEREINNKAMSYAVDIRYFDGSRVKIDGLKDTEEVQIFLVGHHPKTYHEGAVNLTVYEKEKEMADVISHDIGWAVNQLRNGILVRRSGWNGKGMWIAICTESKKMTVPFVYMKTADGNYVPWLCSQTDLLACDWEIAGN
jgi:hypothetical protein